MVLNLLFQASPSSVFESGHLQCAFTMNSLSINIYGFSETQVRPPNNEIQLTAPNISSRHFLCEVGLPADVESANLSCSGMIGHLSLTLDQENRTIQQAPRHPGE